MMRVAITDDHLVVINGIKSMLAELAGYELGFYTQTGKELLQRLETDVPEILLLDIQLADDNGINLCSLIRKNHPAVKVIALTSFEDTSYVKQMIDEGAHGYLLKNIDVQTLRKAFEEVILGKLYIDDAIQKKIVQETLSGKKGSRYDIPLTKREKEILVLITDGLSNKEIADRLYISLRTVETHRFNLIQKLDAKNTAALIKEAGRRGLI
jgi:DNA-binding NarL/FixJ family response regulator